MLYGQNQGKVTTILQMNCEESIMEVLKGSSVVLRPIERRDLEKLNQWKNDEEVYQNLGGGYLPVSINIQEKWMDSLMDTTGNNKRFIIETLSKESLGMVGLYSISWIHRTCELGIYIGEKEQQGKGYGKEAYRLLENFASRYLNLRKIKACVVADNESATTMYEHLGFIKSGELKEERFINGKYHSVFIMEKFLGGVLRIAGKHSKTQITYWGQPPVQEVA